jgi:hypothetical protein
MRWALTESADSKPILLKEEDAEFLVIFQPFNFSCNTFLNNWLKNWGDFVSRLKKSVMQNLMLKRHRKRKLHRI